MAGTRKNKGRQTIKMGSIKPGRMTSVAMKNAQPKGASTFQPYFGKYSAASTNFPSSPGSLLKG